MKKVLLTGRKIEIAVKLIEQGVSYREVSRRLRLSHSTIREAVQGRTPQMEISDDPFTQLRLRAKRCPGCGGLVYIDPCPACSVRRLIATVPFSAAKGSRAA